MKMKKIISSAVSAAVAAAAFTMASGAYVSVPVSGNSGLVATNQNWKLVISGSYNVDYTQVGSLQFVTKVSDMKAYESDAASGFYGDTEKTFTEFTGFIALGANEWFQYEYSGIGGAAGDNGSAASVTASGDGTVVFSADLLGKNITNEAKDWTAISFGEWGNSSPDYNISIVSASLFDKSGNLIISFDGSGNCIASAPAETETETTVPETTPETTTTAAAPETTTTTTAADTTTTTTTTEATTVTTTAEAGTTTSEETTTEETSEEIEETTEEVEEAAATEAAVTTTVTAETTEDETTTAAAETTEEAAQATVSPAAVAAQPGGMTSKSDSLMIVLIAAGVVIVGVIIGFIIVAARRKK